jgi:sugar phosphate isomerase/epimerase
MELGMYTGDISRPNFKELVKAVRGYGFTQIQLDLESVIGETLPQHIDVAWAQSIADEAAEQGVKIVAVTGAFNMAHPDPAMRKEGLKRLRILSAASKAFGSPLVTLCTGSRNQGNPFDIYNMWIRNPENDSPEAWKDMAATMKIALTYAEDYGVFMGIEPEEGTVVDYPSKARNLMDEMGSPWLKVVLDCANLFHKGESSKMQDVLTEAFKILGKDIILAHGKDLEAEPGVGAPSPKEPFTAPGKGLVDYDLFIDLLNKYGYKGGLILHGFKREQDFTEGVTFIRQKLASRSR